MIYQSLFKKSWIEIISIGFMYPMRESIFIVLKNQVCGNLSQKPCEINTIK